MKEKLLVVVLLVLGLVSCKKQEPISDETQISTEIIDNHTAKTSLDWNGTYEGILPCADCEGIITIITLNPDGTFSSKEEYQKEPNLIVENKGSFYWDDSGFVITLEEEEGEFKKSFKVIENAIICLDNEGNEITGNLAPYYRLTKKL